MKASPSTHAEFRRLFDEYLAALNRYCLRRVPRDDVNDVVAEVFTVAWRKIDRMPDFEHALPWLYGVASHQINNRRRSQRRLLALRTKLSSQAIHAEPGPEAVIVRSAEHEELLAALRTLKPEDQELLLLRTHEELDYSQLAVAFDCSPEAARKRLDRAVNRLRRAAGIPAPQEAASGFRAIEEGGDR